MAEFGCSLESCGIDTCGDGLPCDCACHKTAPPFPQPDAEMDMLEDWLECLRGETIDSAVIAVISRRFAKAIAAERQKVLEELKPYLRHEPDCMYLPDKYNCTCGLAGTISKLEVKK